MAGMTSPPPALRAPRKPWGWGRYRLRPLFLSSPATRRLLLLSVTMPSKRRSSAVTTAASAPFHHLPRLQPLHLCLCRRWPRRQTTALVMAAMAVAQQPSCSIAFLTARSLRRRRHSH